MGRPPILYPLFAEVETLPGVGPRIARLLAQMGITRPRDLIFTLPHSGIERRRVATVQGAALPATLVVEVEVLRHLPPRAKGRPWRVEVRDRALSFHLIFFHPREDWIRAQLPVGARRVISGRAELFDGMVQMPHPDYIVPPEAADDIPGFEPVYPLTQGLSQKTMARVVAEALKRAPELEEWIDPALRAREAWPRWHEALAEAHHPLTPHELERDAPARQRLAYDELFAHQLTLALARLHLRRAKGRATQGDGRLRAKVLAALPYTPTRAQLRAVEEIAADMARPERMNRLLQGDVGAGKTLVAFLALLVAVEAGGQGALMAPTEILARQHLAAIRPLAEAAGVRAEILTGRDKGAERAEKLARLAAGEIDILVGTHALFQKEVEFRDLRLAVVDEQHRFGVAQRMELGAKGRAADMLVMTATPIPRSLALAHYGDMDVSLLDEKPPGRKPVKTALVSSARYEEVVAHLREAVERGRQAYWVCPLVEESETLEATAAEERFRALRAALGEGVVGLVHGQMPPAEKDAAMADFEAGRTRVLVATTVIEVGVDVPNATIMVIEHAERFGLAQLHQLRGRVGRGSAQSTCLLMYHPPLTESARRRLEILRETEDGFRIAEEDLAMRGAGDIIGTAQSGLPRFRIADLERQAALMALAQSDARALLAEDPAVRAPRGEAASVLLWLLEEEKAIRLITVG
ncbi:MAG: ATP-dependent DNA helicase RecG [Alphaproteobacteria bacterium]|nr:MAG: ATP-dependent DNA helicase RecG [Alphaproteobacteria bacterium]